MANPALQIENGRAFQAFLNGGLIGSSGNLPGGWYTNNVAPVFSLHETTNGLAHSVIALRVTYCTYEETTPIRIYAGEMQWLADRHDAAALHQSRIFDPGIMTAWRTPRTLEASVCRWSIKTSHRTAQGH